VQGETIKNKLEKKKKERERKEETDRQTEWKIEINKNKPGAGGLNLSWHGLDQESQSKRNLDVSLDSWEILNIFKKF